MRTARAIITLVLIAVLAATVVGCSGGNAAKPVATKTVIMARPSDSENLDPVIQDGNVNIWMFNLVMEGLVKTDSQGTRNDVPSLATEWHFADDKKSITFTLRSGVKFSDGTPLTVEDVIFSLDRARLSEKSPWQFSLEAIDKVEATDKQHVKVSLKQPWAPILADLAMFNATITSKAYFEKVGPEGFSQKPLGTGPFEFAEWKKGEYILVKKNLYYWDKGKPLVDEVKITVVPDDNTRIMQLQGGQVDMIENVPFSRVAELQKDPNINMLLVPSTQTARIGMNNTKKPLDDVRVRNALAYGTDVDALIKIVLFGVGERATSFTPKGSMWNPNIKARPYDPEKAKQLLAEAGHPDGFAVEFSVTAGSASQIEIATVLKEQWAKIGVKVTIKQLDNLTLRSYSHALQHDVMIGSWTNDIVDPSQHTEYMCITEVSKNQWTGWGMVSSRIAEVEKLAQSGKEELDPQKRQEIYYRIQEIVDEEMPIIPLYYTPYTFATSKKITGFVQTPLGNYRFENLDKVTK